MESSSSAFGWDLSLLDVLARQTADLLEAREVQSALREAQRKLEGLLRE